MPLVGVMGGMHFLATIAVAVATWILDVFEEYIVGFLVNRMRSVIERVVFRRQRLESATTQVIVVTTNTHVD